MNKKLFFLPTLLLGALLLFAPSCGTDDPCKDVVCTNADCFEGECVCQVGYEKDAIGNCVDELDRLAGEWSTSEKCDTDPNAVPYKLTFEKNQTISKTINIFNFFNSFATSPVKATVSGNNLTIAKQKPVSGGTLEVEGTGTISVVSGKLEIALQYKVYDSSDNSVTTCNNTKLVK